MCGGAIISGFIPTTRSRRLTSDYLWTDLKKSSKSTRLKSSPKKSHVEDDFEADFQDFKDNYDEEEDEKEDVKPFAEFPTSTSVFRGTAGDIARNVAQVVLESYNAPIGHFPTKLAFDFQFVVLNCLTKAPCEVNITRHFKFSIGKHKYTIED